MSEEEVIQYLSTAPDFFIRNTDLLESLTLPHPVNGRAVSLLEYQVQSLRKTTADYRAEFDRLIDVARENESTMQKSRRLVLAGLTCSSLDDLAVIIDDMVRDDFDVSHHALVFYGEFPESAVRSHMLAEDDVFLSHTAGFTDCFCGMLPANEMSFLFPDDASTIRSVAVLPLLTREGGEVKKRGVLVLGAENQSAFDKEKGALFLQYIADLLSAILLRLLT
ncbi:DUF484 family protein [Marinomonas rhizomae]|uniref:DUF484 family protein n=1 Tax=Marinomonas rhizomae TaxID=491948 RepID=A0A366J7T2_9GAMM|nr:DUF484 family protein [Marinomonas rhizomae]RBP82399.1 hypothetical protein DFP80_10845 [Marinomonas rhizomae]RNF73803.1 DUF484 family protein [Marinomonas rhizomae]